MDANDQYYIRGGKILKAKMDRIYYILIKEQKASRMDQAMRLGLGTPDPPKTHVLEGSLWAEIPTPSEVDDYRTLNRHLELHWVEGSSGSGDNPGDVVLRCHAQDVQRLDPLQYQLLRALDSPADRFKVFQDTSWMAEAVSMNKDSVVVVLKMPGLPERVPAKIRYKGMLKNKNGLWFGVELSAEYHGKGTTNGNYLGDSLFSCQLDSGFFVPINKLRLCHNPGLFHELEPAGGMGAARAVSPEPVLPDYYNEPNPETLPPNLEVGERVVWISDEGDEHGVVRWIGQLPDSKNKEWTVGVEFDRPIGTGTGKYNNKQLFRAKHNHASLIPLLGLMKEDAFYSTIPPLPPLDEEGPYGEHSQSGRGPALFSDPPPPSPPPLPLPPPPPATLDSVDSEEQDRVEDDMDVPDFAIDATSTATSNTMFKPRSVRSIASTNKYADTTSSGTTGSHTPNSDLDTVTGGGAAAAARTQEEIIDSLKRPGSGNTTSSGGGGGATGASSSKYNTATATSSSNKSRTNTPDSSGGSSGTGGGGGSSRYHTAPSRAKKSREKAPLGPKPPEKQKEVVEEKSIYDTDPDHPYENVERPPDYDDDDEGGGNRVMEEMYRTGKAFAADGPLYEPLNSKNKKVEPCKELDYAPLDDYRKQHQDIRTHYPLINPRNLSPHHSPVDPRPPSVPPPAYPATTPSEDAPTPRSASQLSNFGHQTWNSSSNYGSTVRTLGTGTPLTNSNTLLAGSTMSNLTNESSTPTEHSYFTTQTHFSKTNSSAITSPEHAASSLHNSPSSGAASQNNHRHPHTYPHLFQNDSDSLHSKQSYNSLPYLPSVTGGGVSVGGNLTPNPAPTPKPSTHVTLDDAHAASTPPSPRREPQQHHEASGSLWKPEALDPSEIDGELEIGSMVEVEGNPPDCRYGVIKWIGYLRDKHKPIAGLEMELESKTLKEGTFSGTHLFDCPPNKGFFIYLHKLKHDSRFTEAAKYVERSDSLAFGSLECPDIEELCDIPEIEQSNVSAFCGKHKGIQGHHNSCYLDATLFSMFAFSMVFDPILFRQKQKDDIEAYTEVQKVLRDGIVNPLRRNFYVRADKVLKLRSLLDKLSPVKGLTCEEKDPEEFLQVLLQQTLRSPPLLQLSSGQDAYLYQLFLEPDSRITAAPTTQQLLGLSFLQAGLKLKQVPSCLVLQMPRFGKEYKMYSRIVPSLTIDITGILEDGPRECAICGKVARYECKDCLWMFGDGTNLDQCSLCQECNNNSHRHPKRKKHRPVELELSAEYRSYLASRSNSHDRSTVPRQTMELFAVVCIETSHYVAFVKSGEAEDSPWLFFDSMADRMGEQNGYNVPEVRGCAPYVPDWLREDNAARIAAIPEDKQLPEPLRRILCDGYIAMYRSPTMAMYK